MQKISSDSVHLLTKSAKKRPPFYTPNWIATCGQNYLSTFLFGIILIWWTRTPRRHHASCEMGQQLDDEEYEVKLFDKKYFRWYSKPENSLR